MSAVYSIRNTVSNSNLSPNSGISSASSTRTLFEEAEAADQEFQDARRFAREKLDKRSAAIEKILHKMGRGPFRWNGEEVIIVQRGDTTFFRSKNRKEAIDI
jgi:hypothetical protein